MSRFYMTLPCAFIVVTQLMWLIPRRQSTSLREDIENLLKFCVIEAALHAQLVLFLETA